MYPNIKNKNSILMNMDINLYLMRLKDFIWISGYFNLGDT